MEVKVIIVMDVVVVVEDEPTETLCAHHLSDRRGFYENKFWQRGINLLQLVHGIIHVLLCECC